MYVTLSLIQVLIETQCGHLSLPIEDSYVTQLLKTAHLMDNFRNLTASEWLTICRLT